MPRKSAAKTKPRRRRAPRRARVPRGMNPMKHDVASCSDTLGTISISPNTVYSLQNIALTNSARAKTIAQGYQFYRISKVEVKWKPFIDTFSSVGTATVPTLYYMIDKQNTFPSNTTLDTIKQAGARPRRLDDKILTVKFAPAVQVASSDSGSGVAPVLQSAALMKTSPWLTTSANAGGPGLWTPNSVDHRGLVFYVEQVVQDGDRGVCSAEVIIHYQFKKPLWETQVGLNTVHTVNLDTLEIVPPSNPLEEV